MLFADFHLVRTNFETRPKGDYVSGVVLFHREEVQGMLASPTRLWVWKMREPAPETTEPAPPQPSEPSEPAPEPEQPEHAPPAPQSAPMEPEYFSLQPQLAAL